MQHKEQLQKRQHVMMKDDQITQNITQQMQQEQGLTGFVVADAAVQPRLRVEGRRAVTGDDGALHHPVSTPSPTPEVTELPAQHHHQQQQQRLRGQHVGLAASTPIAKHCPPGRYSMLFAAHVYCMQCAAGQFQVCGACIADDIAYQHTNMTLLLFTEQT
jgi:hypothetical protein